MPAYLSVSVRCCGAVSVVTVAGELDLGSAPDLESGIERALAMASALVVIDLKDLRFMDMAGLRVLLNARRAADAVRQEMLLANARQPVLRILSLAQVDGLLPLMEGVARS